MEVEVERIDVTIKLKITPAKKRSNLKPNLILPYTIVKVNPILKSNFII